jgi:Mrp family chromosome partitioning ATPase
MTLAQYWEIMVKRWRLIVMCFLAVGLGALIGSHLMTPLYQSTVLIQISIPANSNQSDYTSLLASDQLVQTEAILATSDSVLREVTSHYPGLTVDQLSKEAKATPKLNTQLFAIDVLDPSPSRAATLANDIATTLIRQQQQLVQQQQAQPSDYLLIAQPAQPASKPVRPNTPLNTGAGLLTGLLLGVLLAVLYEQLDTRVRTPEAVTRLLDWPVLATIWQARHKEDVINPKGRNHNVESFRILRTNIGFSSIDESLHTLVVTSALPRDGKSSVAANLAIFMAKAGKNTLLIDADLRRPTQHELFGLPADMMGFSNAILAFSVLTAAHLPAYQQLNAPTTSQVHSSAPDAARISLDPFVHAVDIPNLCVMPSGPLPPNPPELLESKAMKRLFEALASCGAEVIIFDTPPLLSLSDTSILASKVDGTLFVADISRANRGNLKRVKAILTQARARVVGCVVNKERLRRGDTTYYNYYYSNTDERNGRSNHSTKNTESSVLSPATSDILEQQETRRLPKGGRNGTANATPDVLEQQETRPNLDALQREKGWMERR